jgi:hypothetical protein
MRDGQGFRTHRVNSRALHPGISEDAGTPEIAKQKV